MSTRFQNTPGVYFRFYVGQEMQGIGMADWKRRSEAVAHTRISLAMADNDTRMSELANTIGARNSVISAVHVGREPELKQLEKCLADGSKERRVFVLYGLGGAGKTQLALRFAELHRDKYEHIFYVDATSATTINTELKNIALAKKAGDSPSDALSWLAKQPGQWLMVYNNADDPSLDLCPFFPTSSRGKILITTRNRRITTLAHGTDPDLHISGMSTEEAQELLAKATGASCNLGDAGEELGNLALAIVHAGAYIRTHCCTVQEYHDMYQASHGRLLEEYDQHVPKIDNYKLTVYATWRVSYERLDPHDRQLYSTMAFMHHEHISEDMFRLAAMGLRQYKSALPLSEEELSRKQIVSEMLAHYQTSNQGWDKAAFLKSIDGLQAYSLVAFDTANKSYSIHPLVHQWTRTQVQDSRTAQSCAALLLASCVTQNHKSEDYAFRRMLLNHIDALPEEEKSKPQLAGRIKIVYYEAGHYEKAGLLAEQELQAKARQLGEEHLSTLTCKTWKASIFSKQGQWREAEILQKEVLDVIKRVGGEQHHYTLTSMANLAVGVSVAPDRQILTRMQDIYRNQGRWEEAEELGRKVVEVSKRVLGNEHSNTTTRIGNLACTLWKRGKWQEAEALDREVIEIKTRIKGKEHIETLTGMANLATALWSQGQWHEAEILHQDVLELSKRTRGNEHPYTLKCMHNLASAYWSQKKWREAEKLQQEVVEVSEKVQGPEHPQTLKSMANLAEIYRHQKRWEDAEVLERKVVEVRIRKFGSEHPDSLKSQANLALTCRGLGRLAEAEELMTSAVNASKTRWLAEIRHAREAEARDNGL
ncbi:hypothetical protein FRC10_003688 [Ceratobasidium sp. 414]|nr:hypothetical protein FRC10_003688 [Ceratobasidium sp. 414]